jgi:hypothetical protein
VVVVVVVVLMMRMVVVVVVGVMMTWVRGFGVRVRARLVEVCSVE